MEPVSRNRGILFAILMACLPGCASTPMPETDGEGEHIDDTVIPNRVKAAIVDEPLPTSLPSVFAVPAAQISHA